PIDVTYFPESPDNIEEEFSESYVRHISEVMISLQNKVHDTAHDTIQEAQKRQRRDYNKRHQPTHTLKPGDHVLLRNLKRDDRKGGKYSTPWLGQYTCG